MRLVLLFYISIVRITLNALKSNQREKKQVLSYVLGWDVLVFSFLNFRGIFFVLIIFKLRFLCACAYHLFAYFFSLSSGVLTRKIKTGSRTKDKPETEVS